MANTNISVRGALAGGLTGLAADLAIAELTGHHILTGLWELIGAGVGMFRLDRRIYEAIQDTLRRAKVQEDEDYRQVAERIDEMTMDLPELRETILRLVEAGISAQKA
ncbi:hypothetical protein [Desulfobacca acetoxidans]|uniref:Uncharacterized protein n=1 Tax=Desulfobacca acetoxidans (strain ATCC 700848 / DSM 11109 / ASRB2) TaxID=880072 RepID=F2NG99_DESAR|nr:hypothetical protein [Desulfobacca acetoxidans]AEB08512.1 hypothetical protein Desac_0629 [Desulfobacca acetoxidans DSM 11109]